MLWKKNMQGRKPMLLKFATFITVINLHCLFFSDEDDWLNVQTLPMIMHLDVAAMYPNIILTNRLQPTAIVSPTTCAVCDFNKPGAQWCALYTQTLLNILEKRLLTLNHFSFLIVSQRKMKWTWKGEYLPANRSEYELIKSQLENEWITKGLNYPESKQLKLIRQRLKEYSHTVYKKQKVKEEEEREAIVCMRENPFYVDTVRAFRDRRYTYKNSLKVWQTKKSNAKDVSSYSSVHGLFCSFLARLTSLFCRRLICMWQMPELFCMIRCSWLTSAF